MNDANCDIPAPIYSFITAYRLLMLRHVSSDTWGRVARLPDHILARASTSEFETQQTEIVNFLRRRCFLAKQFSDEDIHRAIGLGLNDKKKYFKLRWHDGECSMRYED